VSGCFEGKSGRSDFFGAPADVVVLAGVLVLADSDVEVSSAHAAVDTDKAIAIAIARVNGRIMRRP
jgi:hypothetical protein